jgi:STE24 endopeptidase
MSEREPVHEFYEYDPNKRALARHYENVKLILDIVAGTIVPVIACVFLLISGISVQLSRLFLAFTGSYWVSVTIYGLAFIVVLQLVETPFMFYSGYIVDHEFGLSMQRVKDWVVDELKSFGLEAGLGVLLVLVLYYLIKATGIWWLVAAVLFALFSILLSVVLPYLIMPIFYKVTPLADLTLKDKLLNMVKGVGTKNIDRVLVADESRRSVRANAMFSGIGNTKAIILFDTLIKKFTNREVTTVVAHELGHYVNKDIWRSAVVSGLMAIPPFLLADYLLRNSAADLGFTGTSDPAGLPMIFVSLIAVGFLLQPISNSISRRLEFQADEFALRAADDSDAQASAEKRLADMNLSVDQPNRLIEFFFYTHPSSSVRVKLAEDWKKKHSISGSKRRQDDSGTGT